MSPEKIPPDYGFDLIGKSIGEVDSVLESPIYQERPGAEIHTSQGKVDWVKLTFRHIDFRQYFEFLINSAPDLKTEMPNDIAIKRLCGLFTSKRLKARVDFYTEQYMSCFFQHWILDEQDDLDSDAQATRPWESDANGDKLLGATNSLEYLWKRGYFPSPRMAEWIERVQNLPPGGDTELEMGYLGLTSIYLKNLATSTDIVRYMTAPDPDDYCFFPKKRHADKIKKRRHEWDHLVFFAYGLDDSMYGIDLDPAGSGRFGQIVEITHDPSYLNLVADDFDAFIDMLSTEEIDPFAIPFFPDRRIPDYGPDLIGKTLAEADSIIMDPVYQEIPTIQVDADQHGIIRHIALDFRSIDGMQYLTEIRSRMGDAVLMSERDNGRSIALYSKASHVWGQLTAIGSRFEYWHNTVD